MAQKTIPVPYGKIKRMLAEGQSSYKISQVLHLPESTVRKIKAGEVIHEIFGLKKPVGDDLCTHCGFRPKGPNFRFLCLYCYRRADDDPVYSVDPGALRVLTSSSKNYNLS